jgi:hypothetical protein
MYDHTKFVILSGLKTYTSFTGLNIYEKDTCKF